MRVTRARMKRQMKMTRRMMAIGSGPKKDYRRDIGDKRFTKHGEVEDGEYDCPKNNKNVDESLNPMI